MRTAMTLGVALASVASAAAQEYQSPRTPASHSDRHHAGPAYTNGASAGQHDRDCADTCANGNEPDRFGAAKIIAA